MSAHKNLFPIVLHADNSPTLLLGLVESLVETANVRISLGLQIPFLEFLRSRAERAELVYSRARGREGECRKRLREHLVEALPGCDAGADMRTELVTGLLRNEGRHVADEQGVVGGIVVRRGERAYRAGLHCKWGYGRNQSLLQREQCWRRPCDDTRYAGILAGYIVVFVRLQLQAGEVSTREDLFGNGIDLV